MQPFGSCVCVSHNAAYEIKTTHTQLLKHKHMTIVAWAQSAYRNKHTHYQTHMLTLNIQTQLLFTVGVMSAYIPGSISLTEDRDMTDYDFHLLCVQYVCLCMCVYHRSRLLKWQCAASQNNCLQ